MELVFSGNSLLFVPARASTDGEQGLFEMRQAPDEPMTALAFTSRDRLVAGCGDHQPWVAVPADSVLAQFEHAGVSRVIIDGLLAPEQRWTIAGSPAEPTVHT